MTDEPIENHGFISGVDIVDIGDLRVARGMTRRPSSSCTHRSLSYDTRERRIWCSDCESDVEGFDAFVVLVEHYNGAHKSMKRRELEVAEAEKFALRSLAARAIDKAWRSRKMLPACPSCGAGLFPEDFKEGVGAMVGREYATARRKKPLNR